MSLRTRLALTGTVLVIGALTSACGGSGGDSGSDSGGGSGAAPTDASAKEFCGTQTSLFAELMGDGTSVPSNSEMAAAVKDWATKLQEVGTPTDISADARAGFEDLIEQARAINADDFSITKLEELSKGGADASQAVRKQATAFSDYLTKTCGDPLKDVKMPELPGTPSSSE